MRLYIIKTGLAPFPNASNLSEVMNEAIQATDYQKALFYYLLAEYAGEKPSRIFEDNRLLENIMRVDDNFREMVDDAVLNYPQQLLESVPQEELRM
jgi:hypothetical protein